MKEFLKKEKQHSFNLILFHISNIERSCSCSLDDLKQIWQTNNESLFIDVEPLFADVPHQKDMDLLHFVSNTSRPLFRVFPTCLMCCFKDIRVIIFREVVCILETQYSSVLLDYFQDMQKCEESKEHPFLYLFAMCSACIDIWKGHVYTLLDDKVRKGNKRGGNIFSLVLERGEAVSNAQQTLAELKEFLVGMSSLLKNVKDNNRHTAKDPQLAKLFLYLQEASCLHCQLASIFETISDMECEAQIQTRFNQTKLVAFNFFFNIILSSCLIGATSGNSFGTNLNIPPYNSTKGIDGYLWYIVSGGSFVIFFSLLALFLSQNRLLLKFLQKCLENSRNRKPEDSPICVVLK